MSGMLPSVGHPNARAVDWAAHVLILPLLLASHNLYRLEGPERAVRDNESQEPDTVASRG